MGINVSPGDGHISLRRVATILGGFPGIIGPFHLLGRGL